MEPGWHSSSCSPVNSICAYIFMLVTSFLLGETSKSTFSMSRILSIRVSVSLISVHIFTQECANYSRESSELVDCVIAKWKVMFIS